MHSAVAAEIVTKRRKYWRFDRTLVTLGGSVRSAQAHAGRRPVPQVGSSRMVKLSLIHVASAAKGLAALASASSRRVGRGADGAVEREDGGRRVRAVLVAHEPDAHRVAAVRGQVAVPAHRRGVYVFAALGVVRVPVSA